MIDWMTGMLESSFTRGLGCLVLLLLAGEAAGRWLELGALRPWVLGAFILLELRELLGVASTLLKLSALRKIRERLMGTP